MSESLSGKRALVTGGSRGIGLAVARALLSEGVHVVICAREPKRLDATLDELRGSAGAKLAGHRADVSRSQEVASLFQFVDEQLGGLDILINNAGLGVFRAAGELSIEEWDQVIGVNLSGAFYCAREAFKRFQRAKGGAIINISSLAGKNPFAGGAAYNASKFGLNGLSEATMLDHRFDNVRVSYIMPGSVATGFSGQEQKERSSWKIAPEDIADIVLHILHMPARTMISRVEVRPSRPEKN